MSKQLDEDEEDEIILDDELDDELPELPLNRDPEEEDPPDDEEESDVFNGKYDDWN